MLINMRSHCKGSRVLGQHAPLLATYDVVAQIVIVTDGLVWLVLVHTKVFT